MKENLSTDQPYAFEIDTREGRVYLIKAESREEMLEWIEKLGGDTRSRAERLGMATTPGESHGHQEPIKMKISAMFCTVGSLKNNETYVWPSDRVGDAKVRIAHKYGWTLSDFPLYYNSTLLRNDQPIKDLGVEAGSTLRIGQTPKSLIGFLFGIILLGFGVALYLDVTNIDPEPILPIIFGGLGLLVIGKFVLCGSALSPFDYAYGRKIKSNAGGRRPVPVDASSSGGESSGPDSDDEGAKNAEAGEAPETPAPAASEESTPAAEE